MQKRFKVLGVVLGLAAAQAASATALIDYAALGTSVSTELTAGIAAAVVTVGLIWGARIGLKFVRSIMK